ncbi:MULTISPECIES: Uma2 family endonuclease [unclassified Bacillus (in: firmicutes)]|uniref:Uma2 family endonuclease n=1 Tax=unclassified Bacillus (in: firmicutes) TaxID=185979 RepID=UPI0015CF6F1F|nr:MULTISPECIES: Uma2 family endonuclease [unclassified Bacillus (in: firmicutes)]
MEINRNEERGYTFQDYLSSPEGSRYEIYDGEPVLLAAPTTKHQGIVSFLTTEFGIYLKGKECRVFVSPFCVRFSELKDYERADNVYEPDLSIIFNKSQIDQHGCKGAPNLIVEVLSPSTARNDRLKKYNTYQKHGVSEYWIVDPINETIEIHALENSVYRLWNVYSREDVITSKQFEDLQISGEETFSYGE